MNRRILRKLWYILLALLMTCFIAIISTITTETGLKICIFTISHFIPGTLKIDTIQGRLINTAYLHNCDYQYQKTQAHANQVAFKVNLASLLLGHIHITSLNADQITINSKYFIYHIGLTANIQKKAIIFQNAIVSIPLHTLTLQGHIQRTLPYQTDVTGNIHTAFPGHESIETAIQLVGSATNTMRFTLKTTKPFTASLDATFQNIAKRGPFKIAGNWKNLFFPLSRTNNIASRLGTLNLSGSLKRYTLQMNSDVSGINIPAAQLRIAGQGDTNQLTLTRIEADTLQGHIHATASLGWKPVFTWQTKLQCTHLNPGMKWPDWLGDINFDLESRGKLLPQQPSVFVRLQNVRGQLQNHPIKGYVQCNLQNRRLTITRSHLSIGNDFVHIRGHLDRTWDLYWKLNAPNITELLANATGVMYSEGTLTGNRNAPHLKGYFNTRNLFMEDLYVQHIATTFNINLTPRGIFDGKLSGNAITWRQYEIRNVNASLTGTLQQHTFSTTLQTQNEKLSGKLVGKYQDHTFIGQLTELWLQPKNYPRWQLQNPTEIRIAPENITVTPFILRSQNAKISGQAAWENYNTWRLQLDIDHLPTALFDTLYPFNLQIDTKLDGAINLQSDAKNHIRGTVEAKTNTCHILDQKEKERSVTFDQITAHVGFDKKGTTASTKITENHKNILDCTANLPGYYGQDIPKLSQTIQAHLTTNFNHLNILPIFIPNIDHAAGTLSANINLNGNITHPKLTGYANIQNGQIHIIPFNVTPQKIQITAQSKALGAIAIKGQAQSGDGTLKFTGETTLKNWMPNGKLHITGTDVLAYNTDEYKITASPNITLTYDQPKLILAGDIAIPQAKLTPQYFTHVVHLPSNAIIIRGQKHTQRITPMELYIDLNLILGKDIEILLDGLSGNITGDLNLHLAPEALTTASGQLKIRNGKYDIYGSTLKIDKGLLIYTGGPLSDPGLNIRATKTVKHYMSLGSTTSSTTHFASTLQDITVGMQVTGTISRPKLTLFSEPAGLRDADILSYLILDTSSSNASSAQGKLLLAAAQKLGLNRGFNIISDVQETFGLSELGITTTPTWDVNGDDKSKPNTAFIIGKKITPKLHLSYSVGLLDPINILRLHYAFTKSWSLQSETSTLDSGADLFYTIETN